MSDKHARVQRRIEQRKYQRSLEEAVAAQLPTPPRPAVIPMPRTALKPSRRECQQSLDAKLRQLRKHASAR